MGTGIKLMAEYCTHPLWWYGEDAVDPIDPAVLPLSATTRERLCQWADAYTKRLRNMESSILSSEVIASEDEAAAFEQEGLRLWAQLRDELGPAYTAVTVVYFSERQRRLLVHPGE